MRFLFYCYALVRHRESCLIIQEIPCVGMHYGEDIFAGEVRHSLRRADFLNVPDHQRGVSSGISGN